MKTKHEDKSFILERGLLVAYRWFAMTCERAPAGYCRGDGESSGEASLRQARGESKRERELKDSERLRDKKMNL